MTAVGRVKTALYLSSFRKIGFVVFLFVFAGASVAQNAFYSEPFVDLLSGVQSTAVFLLVFKRHLKRFTEGGEIPETA